MKMDLDDISVGAAFLELLFDAEGQQKAAVTVQKSIRLFTKDELSPDRSGVEHEPLG